MLSAECKVIDVKNLISGNTHTHTHIHTLVNQHHGVLTQMHDKKKDQRAGEDEEERGVTKRIKKRSGQGDDVYLFPVHWVMDDGCLRFLEEEEEEAEIEEHGRKRKRNKRGKERKGTDCDIMANRGGISVKNVQRDKKRVI